MSERRFLSQFSFPCNDSHLSLLVSIHTADSLSLSTDTLPEKELVTFSYAPFAHLMERQNLLVGAFAGGRIALFDQDISHLFTEIGVVAPTWLMAVPRVWNDVYSRFQARVAEALAKLAEEQAGKQMTQAAKDVARRRLENELLAEIRASLGGKCVSLGGYIGGDLITPD